MKILLYNFKQSKESWITMNLSIERPIKKTILIILILVSLVFISCNNGTYKHGGTDFKGYEIVYRILSDKQVEEVEKQITFVNEMPGSLMKLAGECSVVAEIEIESIDTVAYKRKESPIQHESYFSILNGIVKNVYKGESQVVIGDKIKIETDKSFVYLQDLHLYLETGNSYYMFLLERSESWSAELVDYILVLETKSYDYMTNILSQ
ncbi:MAG TPA: hypothetical protein PLP30_03555 [Clostridia bacterium]|nr:hypothetical protein [Clostridia bacterium]HPQ46422.1 hypothetical protein [Clostridia bacterium]HRX42797.1 hypothetical protein [Clostridia bacterium]